MTAAALVASMAFAACGFIETFRHEQNAAVWYAASGVWFICALISDRRRG